MKAKRRMIVVTIVLAFLAIMLFSSCSNASPIASSQPTLSDLAEPLSPQLNGPLPNGEVVSLADAQAKTSYTIPLPEGVGIKQVWVSTNAANPSEQSIAVQFNNDLLLIIHEMAKPPDWDGIIASTPEFAKIDVNGDPGIGTDPGFTRTSGKDYFHPGSVSWWVDGLNITLYSDTLLLEELLKVAQTVH